LVQDAVSPGTLRLDQYSGFHGIVVPGTLRDSIFVLEGLLEQQTGLNPVEIMTDTAGSSDIIFGLFWLLGYQFSLVWPMQAGRYSGGQINGTWCPDELARGCVELSKIESQWDEMMRMAGSLKLGTIHASELIRSLLRSRPSGLAQAIMEVGRVNKTLYLLNYIDDEDYRRRILTQLNREKDAMQWLEPFATDNVVRLENATVKGRKINSVLWVW
jgi:TnpA family transposase